jgi:hypothetical protein
MLGASSRDLRCVDIALNFLTPVADNRLEICKYGHLNLPPAVASEVGCNDSLTGTEAGLWAEIQTPAQNAAGDRCRAGRSLEHSQQRSTMIPQHYPVDPRSLPCEIREERSLPALAYTGRAPAQKCKDHPSEWPSAYPLRTTRGSKIMINMHPACIVMSFDISVLATGWILLADLT